MFPDLDDSFLTISDPSPETLFKEKNSKFFGYAFPISHPDELKPIIDEVRKRHPNAGHHCFAFRIGNGEIYERANDDGEPANTAGAPILGQLRSFGLKDALVVVVRYFGGVKLGVGGLIAAYRASAQLTLEASDIIEKEIRSYFELEFDYGKMDRVMRIIREKRLEINTQELELRCRIRVSSKRSLAEAIPGYFSALPEIRITPL